MSSPAISAAAWRVCGLFTVASWMLLRITHTAVAPASLAMMICCVGILGVVHLVYARIRPDRFIGPISGGLAVVTWAAFTAGVTALAALRTSAPLIDDALGKADAALCVDTPSLVAWLARYPVMGLLNAAYVSTVPLVFAAVVVLGWTGREIMMWELCFAFAGCAAACTLLSALMPAVGAFDHFRITPDVLALLPAGAGRFHLAVFDGYRSGALDTIDIRRFEGVVTFPSFHTAMALMIAYASRDLRGFSHAACAWSLLTVIATIPIGGHYAVDDLAGAAVWALVVWSGLNRPVGALAVIKFGR